MTLNKHEKNLFEGFLYRFLLDKENLFYFPRTKGTEIFLKARKKFPEELKIFSTRPGDGKCMVLETLINNSISSGNLEITQSPTGGLLGYKFIITSKLYLDNSAKENYEKNKGVIDYLFKLYKKIKK